MKNVNTLFFALSIALSIIACKQEQKQTVENYDTETSAKTDTSVVVKEDTTAMSSPQIVEDTVSYSKIILPAKGAKRDSLLKDFKSKYSAEEQYTILALNRLDKKNISRADTLVVPKMFKDNFLAYSPFPQQVEALSDVKKIVIFSYPVQAFAVYENGRQIKWGPTSMGKKSAQTKRGLMFTNWKKELAISTVKSEWKLPYNFNIHNTLGIGWHQYDLPGYPASHSCLRLLEDDAKWLFAFADQWILNKGGATTKAKGTPVIVYGDWAWGKAKPWKSLDTDPKATDISEEELTSIISEYKDQILEEQQNREAVVAGMPQNKTAVKDSAKV